MMRIYKPVLIPAILIFSWLVPVFQASAITIDVIDAKPVIEPLPGVKPIQLTAGVYYDPQLAAYEQIRIRSILADKVLIGKNSVELFDTVLPMVFKNVIKVEHLPPYTSHEYPDVDVIIEPAIDYFYFQTGSLLERFSDKHRIDYRVVTYDRNGYPVLINRIKGKSNYEPKLGESIHKHIDADLAYVATRLMELFNKKELMDLMYSSALEKKPLAGPEAADKLLLEARMTKAAFKLDWHTKVDLKKIGIIPVEVSIRNNQKIDVSVDEALMRLQLPDGQFIRPMATSAMFPKIDRYRVGSFALDLIIPSEVIGTIISETIDESQEKADLKRQNTLFKKVSKTRLKSQNLKPGQRLKGVLYFSPDKDASDFDTATLHVRLPANGTLIQKTQVIEGVGYKASKLKRILDTEQE